MKMESTTLLFTVLYMMSTCYFDFILYFQFRVYNIYMYFYITHGLFNTTADMFNVLNALLSLTPISTSCMVISWLSVYLTGFPG